MKKLAIAAALTFGAALPLAADEEADFILNGETEMTIRAPAPEHMENVSEIFSGWVFRSDETQALQTDDFDNPGMIWVDSARENWAEVDGTAGESCASCLIRYRCRTFAKGHRALRSVPLACMDASADL